MSDDQAPPAEKRLDDIHWDGIVAYVDGKSIADNPYEHGSRNWWMWRLAFLAEQEREEYETSLPRQAEKAIEEQPLWERRERVGINDLVKRVCDRAERLGELFGWENVPEVILEMDQKHFREAAEELLARKPGTDG